jgi:hypothetical protein
MQRIFSVLTFSLALAACDDVNETQLEAELDQCVQTADETEAASCVDDVLATAQESSEHTDAFDLKDRPDPSHNHVPCGIYVPPVAYSPGQIPTYHYTIKNCHGYTVKRRSYFSDGSVGACRTYSPGEVYYGSNYGRYPIDLWGC